MLKQRETETRYDKHNDNDCVTLSKKPTGEFSVNANLLTDFFQNRWLQLHALEQGPHDAARFPCLQITQLPNKNV